MSQIVSRRRCEGREAPYDCVVHEGSGGDPHSPCLPYVVRVVGTVLRNDSGRRAPTLIVRPIFNLFVDGARIKTLRTNTKTLGPETIGASSWHH